MSPIIDLEAIISLSSLIVGNNRIYCRDKVSREIQRLEGSHEHTPIVTYIEKDTVDSDSTESIYRLEVQ